MVVLVCLFLKIGPRPCAPRRTSERDIGHNLVTKFRAESFANEKDFGKRVGRMSRRNKLTNVEGEVFVFLFDRSSHKSDLGIMKKSVGTYAATSPECFSFPT